MAPEPRLSQAAVTARSLRKSYKDFVAVDGIDFDIQRGECFGFLGPNGAGKTTTMRMVYRAVPVSGGSLVVLGHEAGRQTADREIKRAVGVVPQEDNLDGELSVRENLEIFCRFYGLSYREARNRSSELLEFVNLSEKANAKVMELSGGMKRRALIARGLAGSPQLLVLDEPTTGLDPQARHNLWERLFALKRKQATLLLTTHYMDEAEQLCDRLVIMDKGKIVAQGKPRELIEREVTRHVVEVWHGEAAAPALPSEMQPLTRRSEALSDRLLLYVDDGEAAIAAAARHWPNLETRLRRSTLEDVFLKITGRKLDE
ncbi:MAG: ATP-binding cassette domain-containing protein [Planctomycetaceae bacterium]|nr:Daunorubicin/doxorubicin resistance ATP-binding protein DrrA [Planctomycetota bacterium]NUO14997.1 ATP-binding cassette domain-containing protein [Planctomycetaceae bacterium]